MDYLEPIREQVNAMAYGFLAFLPNLIIALVLLLITLAVSGSAVRIASRLTGRTGLRPDLKALAETLVRLGIWIVGLLIAAAIVVPGFTPAGLIAGLGVGAVAIGFAFQDIFENFLAGVLIMLREKMQIGDYVEAEGISGIVERITLRETHIRQFSGELTILPNAMMFKNPVKIFTDRPERRFELVIPVSPDSDLEAAEAALRKAVESIESIAHHRDVSVWARTIGTCSIDFLLFWWVNTGEENPFAVQHQVVLAVKAALKDAGIEFAHPIVAATVQDTQPIFRT